jgi:hypothetical protein
MSTPFSEWAKGVASVEIIDGPPGFLKNGQIPRGKNHARVLGSKRLGAMRSTAKIRHVETSRTRSSPSRA